MIVDGVHLIAVLSGPILLLQNSLYGDPHYAVLNFYSDSWFSSVAEEVADFLTKELMSEC